MSIQYTIDQKVKQFKTYCDYIRLEEILKGHNIDLYSIMLYIKEILDDSDDPYGDLRCCYEDLVYPILKKIDARTTNSNSD